MTENLNNLLQACRKGDRKAQRQFYELYKDKMFVLCLRFADTREDAQDLLQEGFVKVFRDLHQYNGMGSLEGWVRKVILNVALLYVRKQKKALQPLELKEWDGPDETDFLAFPDLTTGEMLIRLMQHLPIGFRTVLNLYVLEGYTHPQIAQALGISEGTSKSQLSRAKVLLKKMLEQKLT